MYPNLYYAFKDLLGIELPWLKLFNTFGFCVALSFLAAAWIVTIELKRKEAQGLLHYTEEEVVVGEKATLTELLTNFIIGFIFGYKILGIIFVPNALNDTQSYIFSSQGNIFMGLLLGAVFTGLKWWDKNKVKLDKPEKRVIRFWPHDRVSDLTVLAAIFGFAGAKLFNAFETWDDFIKDPVGSLISFSGLTFYGGLIVAAAAIMIFARKHKINLWHLTDSFAPALMLAYGLGRIGCQISGDGDWGVLNSAFITTMDGKVIPATHQMFKDVFDSNHMFYGHRFGPIETVQSINFPSFAHLPNWLFAYNYPHNVVSEGLPISNCIGNQFCNQLPIPVFPTPLYETIMSLLLFALLFSLRKKIKIPGRIFAIYLMVNGLERFLIEKIRVNSTYTIWGLHPTQAEIISLLLIITGGFLWWFTGRKKSELTENGLI